MLWFLMFPTFIEHGKEIVVFEIKSGEITSRIRSKVSQISLFVVANFVFSFNQQRNLLENLLQKMHANINNNHILVTDAFL